jgi:LmbE family N-acetylglucosaminyl deacetylase
MSFRRRLRPLKRAAARVVERTWRLGMRALRLRSAARAVPWSSSGSARVLVIAPHPDDEAIGCAGTLLLHRRAGDRVRTAIATDGRRSRVIPDPQEMARRRHTEATQAARLLGIEQLDWMGMPEGDWQLAPLITRLREILRDFAPDIVYAPSRVDFHPEHFAVAHALALALSQEPSATPRLRIYQIQVPLTSRIINLVADIASVADQCTAVLRCYETQAGPVETAYRQRRYGGALYGCESLEAFWEMTARRYIELHRDAPHTWPRSFRGLRPFPLSDPLAFIVGGAERRRLLAAHSAAAHAG